MAQYLSSLLPTREAPATPLVLDLACGTGNVSAALVTNGFDVAAIDISQQMLSRARRKNPRVGFVRGDLRKLPFRGTFDGVVCLSFSLSYLTIPDDLRGLVSNLHRITRKGAPVILDVIRPEALDSDWLQREAARWEAKGIQFDFRWLSKPNRLYSIGYSPRRSGRDGVWREAHVGRAYTAQELHDLFEGRGLFKLEASSVLDASCGTSHLSYYVATRSGADVGSP
ncbi:class I SAM-dependent methyltransferase [Micromonospora psammae]|uniref:class I SAM-dependent methyltransferase n=1 Tax=Micromonospora sp. CPCC 205556 TaxID=3122398 RepID=UPI002FEFC93F